MTAKELDPTILIESCRTISTGFFRENRLDREEVAVELASILELPIVRVELVQHTPGNPERPKRVSRTSEPSDLFVSYYHQDAEFVRRLSSAVASKGYTVWYDRLGLSGGMAFPRVIEQALEVTRFVGLVATAEAVERPWVRREMDATYTREGEEGREILVPLRIDNSELPLFVRTKTWCDFRTSFQRGLHEVIDILQG